MFSKDFIHDVKLFNLNYFRDKKNLTKDLIMINQHFVKRKALSVTITEIFVIKVFQSV